MFDLSYKCSSYCCRHRWMWQQPLSEWFYM